MSKANLVVIPVYNEAASISRVIPEICKHIDRRRTDILAIDDGSKDASSSLIKSFDCTRLKRHKKNRGYGRTLVDGFRYALRNGYRYLVTIDCDEQHQPTKLRQFFSALRGVDVLSGSRYLRRYDKAVVPPERLKINQQTTDLVNRLTGYSLTDAFCGFKGYKVSSLKGMRLKEDGYGMPLEFWVKASAAGLKVKELPVDLIYTDHRRSFRKGLDDSVRRTRYYHKVLKKALREVGWEGKWK